MKIDQHIEIVRSSKSGLSSMSQRSCDAILAALTRYYTRVGVTIVNDWADLEDLIGLRPDLVFLGMKFVPTGPVFGSVGSNKIWLADYLDANGIAYTGSGQLAHELELNKPMAKQRMLESGLETSSFCEILQGQTLEEGDISLRYPLFVKPTSQGGGIGIDSDSVVQNFAQLQAKVNSLSANFEFDALVEEYLPGREFSVAILKNEGSADYMAMPLELIAPEDINGERILSAKVKAADSERFIEIFDEVTKQQVNELAISAFYALGARDYGRIDIRLDKFGTPQFLEANLIPSLIEGYGNFPKACLLNINLDYENMILSIVRLGMTRASTTNDNVTVPASIIEDLDLRSLRPLPEAV